MLAELFCEKSKTLLGALEIINRNGKNVVFVVDEKNTFFGLLTDGDIRRLLLKGHNLQEPVAPFVNKNSVYARVNESTEEMLAKINSDIWIMPILDNDNRVVDFFEFRKDVHVPVITPNLKGNEFKYLVDAFLSTWISSRGDYIERFEKNFSSYCDTQYGVATSNGTTALHLALMALGIGKGDEVIVPDLTFAATINAVLYTQATPVIVDIDEKTWCIDPAEVEKAITPKTKAIIPVHLYGQPCAMDPIMALAKKHGLYVVEDCAQAHGAVYHNRKVGSIGHIGCFSFFGNKIITTGEGGMCVTNDKELSKKMRILRDHGMSPDRRYWHEVVGFNYRMTNLQAAIGVAQLERIDEILNNRLQVEKKYDQIIGEIDCVSFQKNNVPGCRKVTWLVSALLLDGKRDQHVEEFKKNGIDVRPFFYPLGDMPIYQKFLFSNAKSRSVSSQGVNFPSGLDVKEEMIVWIKNYLEKTLNKVQRRV